MTLLYKLWFIQRFPLDFITLSAFSFVFFFSLFPSKCDSVIQVVVHTAFPLDFITLSAFSVSLGVFFSCFFRFYSSKRYSVIQAVVHTAFPSWFHFIISLLVWIFSKCYPVFYRLQAMVNSAFPSLFHNIIISLVCTFLNVAVSCPQVLSHSVSQSGLRYIVIFFWFFVIVILSVIQVVVHIVLSSWFHYIYQPSYL